MLLFVIRHGDPVYQPDSLTPRGRMQAQALAKRFAVHGLDRIYSSPLVRAQETARPTAELLGLPVEIEEWTSEVLAWEDFAHPYPDGRNHWVFNRRNTEFLQNGDENLGNGDWRKAKSVQNITDLEHCYDRLAKASDAFLEKLGFRREGVGVYRIVKANGERVALFCHQGFSMAWFPYLLGIPPHLFWSSFDINHTGVSLFEFADSPDGLTSPKCLALSDNSHLLREGLPYRFQNRIDL